MTFTIIERMSAILTFTPGTHHRCTVTRSGISIDTRRAIQQDGKVKIKTVWAKKPKAKVKEIPARIPVIAPKRKPGRPRKVTSLEKQFEASFRVKLCEILATPQYAGITIEQLAKVMPDLTVREILSA